jgi:hypothetical protein
MGGQLKRVAAVAAAFLASAAVPGQALAWNAHSHMLVAAVAWRHMTPAARTKAADLLKLNPMYSTWIADAPAADRDEYAFIRAATWPDKIRPILCPGGVDPQPVGVSTGDKVWHGDLTKICYIDDGSQPPAVPASSRNVGYGDMLLHRYWHFKDVPFSTDGTPTQPPDTPNAGVQIAAFTSTLRSATAPDDQKAYGLAWLVHLVGDMHQPLHATSRFAKKTPHGDNGGNSVKVCTTPANCTPAKAGKLHSFWDGALGSGEEPTAVIAFAAALPPAPAAQVAVTDIDTWISDSSNLARTRVYVSPIGPQTGPYKITAKYRTSSAQLARRQVELGGERLAVLLNGVFS